MYFVKSKNEKKVSNNINLTLLKPEPPQVFQNKAPEYSKIKVPFFRNDRPNGYLTNVSRVKESRRGLTDGPVSEVLPIAGPQL